jgi:hypothetical protein
MKKKIKKIIACMLLGLFFAGVFIVGFSISCGMMTKFQGLVILVSGLAITVGYCSKIEEEK